MELENVTLSKIIQVQKDRHCIFSSRYGFRLLIFLYMYLYVRVEVVAWKLEEGP